MTNENSNQSPVDNSNRLIKQNELTVEAVDKLANELVEEYDNPDFRKWYCGVIYDVGVEQVKEWQERASNGREPAKLFSLLVRQADRSQLKSRNIRPGSPPYKLDKVHDPSDYEMTIEGIEKSLEDIPF